MATITLSIIECIALFPAFSYFSAPMYLAIRLLEPAPRPFAKPTNVKNNGVTNPISIS